MLSVQKEARSRKVAITFLNQYLIPLSSTAETIDSVYISKDIAVLLQIMVSLSHNLNLKGITELTDELPFKVNSEKDMYCLCGETTLKPYKCRMIVAPAEISEVILSKVVEYHQYVYFISMDEI